MLVLLLIHIMHGVVSAVNAGRRHGEGYYSNMGNMGNMDIMGIMYIGINY